MTKNSAVDSRESKPGERTPVTDHKNIGEAFLAIMEEVGYVQKRGQNKAQNYTYAGERQLIEALRPALLRHGVICIPSEAKSTTDYIVVGDKKTFRTVVDYTFVYTHVASSTHIQVAVVGEGVDMGDKSAYKAATGALKYALRQPFLIETGDEPELHDIIEDTGTRPNSPTSGKTPQSVYGTAVKFKQHFADIKDAITRAVDPEHFTWLSNEIEKIRSVDEQCADELESDVENRMGILAQ